MNNLCKIIFIFLIFSLKSEAQTVSWSKWYDYNHLDNEGMDVIQTFDGGYLFLVNTYISFDYSTTLFKTDYLGNIVWQKVYNRKNTGGAAITSYEVKQTKDSGFVFCGDSGGDSAFLIKTNFNGDLRWVKKYSSPGKESRFFGLFVTNDGGFIAGGDVYSPFKGYIVKTDSIGNWDWEVLCGNNSYNIIQAADNNYYSADLNFLFKISQVGKLIWQSEYFIGTSNLSGSNLIAYNPNCIYVCGGLDSMILNRIDSSGSVIWKKGYYPESLGCGSMCLSKDGNFLLAGEINYLLQFDVAVAKVDPDGNLIFTKRINLINGGNYGNVPYSVKATCDSGFIMTGFTDYPRFPYGDNALALKTDSNCNAPKFVNISNISTVLTNHFFLQQNYPNPFNPNTKINYELKFYDNIQLIVYNINGTQIDILVNEKQAPGMYSIFFNPQKLNIPSGIYFYKLMVGNNSQIRKMIYIK